MYLNFRSFKCFNILGKLIPELVTGKWISNSEMITEDFNIWNLMTGKSNKKIVSFIYYQNNI